MDSIDPARYEELRAVVLERATAGTLDVIEPVSELTSNLLNSSQKSALQLLASYCAAVPMPMVNFYGFELAGRKDNRKYLCACDFEGITAFGCPSSSKKAAKNQCALRLLNTLVSAEQLQRHLGPDGKKLAQSGRKATRKNSASTTADSEKVGESNGKAVKAELNFAEDIDPLDEFINFNPTPESAGLAAEERELFERIRTRAFELFSRNILSQFNLSDECRKLLNTCGQNPTSIVNTSCADNRPQYFVFSLPNGQVDKYASLCVFEGGVYYGQVSRSKQLAKTMCSAVIVDRLLKEGKLNVEKLMASRKRASDETASAVSATPGDADAMQVDTIGARWIQPEDKRQKLEEGDAEMHTGGTANVMPKAQKASTLRQCVFLPEENLDARTIYHLATSEKGESHLLNDYFQSRKMMPSSYAFVNLSMGQIKAIVNFVSPASAAAGAQITFEGVPQSTKKKAKASAARKFLNHLIVAGEISVPHGTLSLPTNLPTQEAGGSVFGQFRAATYRSIHEAQGLDPLMSYSGSKVAACFLVDSLSNKATLVAWACGKVRDFVENPISSDVDAINDCCAVTLCRRSLLRFLSFQAKAYGLANVPKPTDVTNNASDKQLAEVMELRGTATEEANDAPNASTDEAELAATNEAGPGLEDEKKATPAPVSRTIENRSIFVRADESGKLKLRANLSFHLYCSELFPGEVVAEMKEDEADAAVNPTSPQRMIDRILKWSTVGVQGALLDLLLEPIFLEAIAVDRKTDGDLLDILARPTPQASEFTPMHHPYVAVLEGDEAAQSNSACNKPEEMAEIQTLAASWNIADGTVEVINPQWGVNALGGPSRLCKLCISQSFIRAARALRSQFASPPGGKRQMEYIDDLKAGNTVYQAALKPLKEARAPPTTAP